MADVLLLSEYPRINECNSIKYKLLHFAFAYLLRFNNLEQFWQWSSAPLWIHAFIEVECHEVTENLIQSLLSSLCGLEACQVAVDLGYIYREAVLNSHQHVLVPFQE